MSLTHCPLCVALAVLSVARSCAYGVLLWQISSQPQARPAFA